MTVPYDSFDRMRSNIQDAFRDMGNRITSLECRIRDLEHRVPTLPPIGSEDNTRSLGPFRRVVNKDGTGGVTDIEGKKDAND